MSATFQGVRSWRISRDDEGYRTYNIVSRVKSLVTDGPLTVMGCPGLPAIGSTWDASVLGIDGGATETDSWAYCWPTMTVSMVTENEKNDLWNVAQTFSTKPLKRCQTTQVENPLDEPAKISGSFVRYTQAAFLDRNLNAILNSAFQPIKGPAVERDFNRPTVRIQKNYNDNQLSTFADMIDTVNDDVLWDLPARCIKLGNVTWERAVYGVCNYYYPTTYEFEVNYKTWDRDVPDEGTMALAKGGDPSNPTHYIPCRAKGSQDIISAPLDGNGHQWDGTGTSGQGQIHIEFYDESNFLLLGIPTSL